MSKMNLGFCESSEDKEKLLRFLGMSDKEQHIKEKAISDSDVRAQRNEPLKKRGISSGGNGSNSKTAIPRHLTAPIADRDIKEEVPSDSEIGAQGNVPPKKQGISSGGDSSNSKNAIPHRLTAPIADRDIKKEVPSDSEERTKEVKKRKTSCISQSSNSKGAVSRRFTTPAEEQIVKREIPSDSEKESGSAQHRYDKASGSRRDLRSRTPIAERDIREEEPSDSEEPKEAEKKPKSRSFISKPLNSEGAVSRRFTTPAEEPVIKSEIPSDYIKEEEPSYSEENTKDIKKRKYTPRSPARSKIVRPVDEQIVKSEVPFEKGSESAEHRQEKPSGSNRALRSKTSIKDIKEEEEESSNSKTEDQNLKCSTGKDTIVRRNNRSDSQRNSEDAYCENIDGESASSSPAPLPLVSDTDHNVTDESITDLSQNVSQNSSNSSSDSDEMVRQTSNRVAGNKTKKPIRRRMKKVESLKLTREEKEARRKEKNRVNALNYLMRKKDKKKNFAEKHSLLRKKVEFLEKQNKTLEKSVLSAYSQLVDLSSGTDSPYGSLELFEEQLITQKIAVCEEVMEKDDNGRDLQKLEEESFAAEDKFKEIVENGFPEGALRTTITSQKCRAKSAFELAKLSYETKFVEVEIQKKETFGRVLDEFLEEINKLLETFGEKKLAEKIVEEGLTERTE
ncbi:hypothetical protein GCK72_025804 [Caenorhabditis remanei]|uniref:BZIP domain-containing protein n=1 Tax=Caenorhabditis remanei TaxID=31234 RepID=A0A6A5G328_CAERE|nr:hypothetical protein GCK72_025804 [Caenorhabditis remanei]KAF1749337.1 hypothetical protein GCK72_025804 [Caenorhabditis remanei]